MQTSSAQRCRGCRGNDSTDDAGEHGVGVAACRHTPDQTYTRRPCSCGRPLWPPRGRGRGESLTSPRRIEAKLRALDALALHICGLTYRRIARELGYQTAQGAWSAVQRIRSKEAAWYRSEEDSGRRKQFLHEPSAYEMGEALARLEEELATGGLDGKRLQSAKERLRGLLLRHARASR